MKRQRWPEKPLILGRSGTQCVAMVIKLLSSYRGAHLVESYCQKYNILIQIGCHHLANLHTFRTQISLEQKEIMVLENMVVNSICLLIQTKRLCFKMA